MWNLQFTNLHYNFLEAKPLPTSRYINQYIEISDIERYVVDEIRRQTLFRYFLGPIPIPTKWDIWAWGMELFKYGRYQ